MRDFAEEWEEKGRFADLTILGCGNRRRLVDTSGKIVLEYTMD